MKHSKRMSQTEITDENKDVSREVPALCRFVEAFPDMEEFAERFLCLEGLWSVCVYGRTTHTYVDLHSTGVRVPIPWVLYYFPRVLVGTLTTRNIEARNDATLHASVGSLFSRVFPKDPVKSRVRSFVRKVCNCLENTCSQRNMRSRRETCIFPRFPVGDDRGGRWAGKVPRIGQLLRRRRGGRDPARLHCKALGLF